MAELAARPLRPLASAERHHRSSERYSLILREDPELADGLSRADREIATRLFRARVIQADPGLWQPPLLDAQTAFGLLVLDGLIGRRTRVGPGTATDVIGAGDVLRPWEADAWDPVSPEVEWRAFQLTRLAVLDGRITRLIGQRPELVVAFSGRLLRRVRAAQYLRAVGSLARVEPRLLGTLWHLASNWGVVTPRGVRIPYRLSQVVLAEMIGARRPSVSSAVARLKARGELACEGSGCYILTGDPYDWATDLNDLDVIGAS